jgi:Gly-Xaa carboxypeptidase
MKPVGQDSRWGVFQDYHKYLERSFPTMWAFYSLLSPSLSSNQFHTSYTSLQVNTVNTYGLVLTFPHPVSAALRLMQHQVFHWQGSDTSLKPTLLAAHQGIVMSAWIAPSSD